MPHLSAGFPLPCEDATYLSCSPPPFPLTLALSLPCAKGEAGKLFMFLQLTLSDQSPGFTLQAVIPKMDTTIPFPPRLKEVSARDAPRRGSQISYSVINQLFKSRLQFLVKV